jgi:hypothetical protein
MENFIWCAECPSGFAWELRITNAIRIQSYGGPEVLLYEEAHARKSRTAAAGSARWRVKRLFDLDSFRDLRALSSLAGSVRLRLIPPARNDFVDRRGKLLHSACNVSEATKFDAIWTQNDHRREVIDVKLVCQLLVLHENVRCAFLRLVEMNFAEKKVVFAVVGKLSLVEYLAVEFQTGNAPIGPKKTQQQRPVCCARASCSRRKICVITYVAGESAAAENSRQIAADYVRFATHLHLC